MTRREFLLGIGSWSLMSLLAERRNPVDDENKYQFLKRINRQFNRYREVILKVDVFDNFISLNKENILTDYEMYFPFYKAGEITYQVPWFLLWLIHEEETRASRSPNPEVNGYVGAMQRSAYFYDDKYVKEAAKNWGFLERLPQRYKKNIGWASNDYEEILFASRKIHDDAIKILSCNTKLSYQDACLEAQFCYCNPISAKKRIDQFKKIYPFFKKDIFQKNIIE